MHSPWVVQWLPAEEVLPSEPLEEQPESSERRGRHTGVVYSRRPPVPTVLAATPVAATTMAMITTTRLTSIRRRRLTLLQHLLLLWL